MPRFAVTPGQGYLMRIRGRHSGFVEVENVTRKEAASHCSSTLAPSKNLRLRFYVKRPRPKSLAQWTRTSFDGSSARTSMRFATATIRGS